MNTNAAVRSSKSTGWLVPIFVALAVFAVAAGVVVGLHLHFGGGDHSSKVAVEADAVTCMSSGYYIDNRLGGGRQTIYDCSFADGTRKCVTDHGGIATDSTEVVRLLFQNALGQSMPSCATAGAGGD